jgi:hypothetical protein
LADDNYLAPRASVMPDVVVQLPSAAVYDELLEAA